jgi:hypothetical protein
MACGRLISENNPFAGIRALIKLRVITDLDRGIEDFPCRPHHRAAALQL